MSVGKSNWAPGLLGTAFIVASFLPCLTTPGAFAGSSGEGIFMKQCAGCHMGGKNMINPKKPIIGSLQLKSKADFKTYLLKSTVPMPSFPKIACDDADLTALYNYCKKLK